jgi:hypothetical protein
MAMKTTTRQWLGAGLILIIGIIHLYLAPTEYEEARWLGYLFAANFLGAVMASVGIRRDAAWGWVLGLGLAVGSIGGYILSRTAGMPGMPVEEWLYPLGILSLIVEAIFVFLVFLRQPWGQLTGPRQYLLPVAYLLAVLAFGFFGYLQSTRAENSGLAHLARARLISESDLLNQYGMRVRLVGLSMMGSIVDFRIDIVDEKKAQVLIGSVKQMPMLAVESKDIVLMAPMPHSHSNHKLKEGYYFHAFYPNTGSVIQPGTPVTVILGDLKLAPVPAQQ